MPAKLYHVTTNYASVIKSGVLLAKSGLESGGLGGTESLGVSFVTDKNIAKGIYDELTLINSINNASDEKEVLVILNNINDIERKSFILNEYDRTISVYKNFKYAALMALRLSRNSLKFYNKSFHGLVIFHEEKIKNKDIGIIEINKDKIPENARIIEGVDKDLGEIRILDNIRLK